MQLYFKCITVYHGHYEIKYCDIWSVSDEAESLREIEFLFSKRVIKLPGTALVSASVGARTHTHDFQFLSEN